MSKTYLLTVVIALAFICVPLSEIHAEGSIKDWFTSLFKKNAETSSNIEHPDLAALTVDENLEIPELSGKEASRVRSIQKTEANRLKAIKGIKTEMLRDNEVIRVTIPASSLFAPNDTALHANADAVLRPLLQCLRTPDYYHMLLVMHSDNTGNDAYTYALTTRRVLAVFDWLDRNGAVTDYVVPYAAGSHEPLAANNSAENRNRNRRLEIYLIPAEAMLKK